MTDKYFFRAAVLFAMTQPFWLSVAMFVVLAIWFIYDFLTDSGP